MFLCVISIFIYSWKKIGGQHLHYETAASETILLFLSSTELILFYSIRIKHPKCPLHLSPFIKSATDAVHSLTAATAPWAAETSSISSNKVRGVHTVAISYTGKSSVSLLRAGCQSEEKKENDSEDRSWNTTSHLLYMLTIFSEGSCCVAYLLTMLLQ